MTRVWRATVLAILMVGAVSCSESPTSITASRPSLLEVCEFPDPNCQLRPPDFSEHVEMVAAANAIDESYSGCGAIKQAVLNHLSGHTTQMYDAHNSEWGDHHTSPEEMHIWAGTVGSGQDQATLIHEGAHHVGYGTAVATFMEEACHG